MNDPSPAESLCLSCGMCCSGTLHNWTNLRSHELGSARSLGLGVFTRRDGTAAFRQPCARFEEPFCTVYTQRPQSCREYVCPLLKRLMDGEVSLEEALGHTRQVRGLIASLRSHMPEDMEGLPLETQVRLSWPPEAALPPEVEPIFRQLVVVLKEVWRVKWRRKFSTAKTTKKR